MMLLFLLFLCVTLITGNPDIILGRLRSEIALSKTNRQDHVIRFLCETLPSPDFITALEDDDDFLSSMLDELGFGFSGVKRDSWAAKYQAEPRKSASCFSALHSSGTSDQPKMSVANSRKIIRRCCIPDKEL
jgi:hypothetical protein